MNPAIPQKRVMKTEDVKKEEKYLGLRVVNYSENQEERDYYDNNQYQFQHEHADYTITRATISLKGSKSSYRLVATIHPNMKQFVDIVKYDPSDPPLDDYDAQGMTEAHERTQSDFRGQKKQNLQDFKNYILEGISGPRTLYLPTITGWQTSKVFDKAVFVAFDINPNFMYGQLYLPKKPVMQSDGQTQTAAVFQVAKSVDAIQTGALEDLQLTLEIELNVNERQAGQSFADRNGRGSKKNKNLVIVLDSSSALSTLRIKAIENTIFERRFADGRTTSTSETATKSILDLSTLEQILLYIVSNGKVKPEQFKHHYVDYFLPYCREFFKMLETQFADDWPEQTPANKDPYRKIFVHGWPFALKAMAKAYYQSRIDVLGPLSAAIGTEKENHDASLKQDQKYRLQIEEKRRTWTKSPDVTFDELRERIDKIDWHRYRKHWIALTGFAMKSGKKKTYIEKSTGQERVAAQAQNTPPRIDAIAGKLLSDSWKDLCGTENESL